MVRVRFAPSPTGLLHIGGARTALFNYLFAKKNKGTFVLRIEDTDKERSLKEHEKNILNSMSWLGLDWDEGVSASDHSEEIGEFAPYRQSERLDRHLALAEKLKSSSAAYTDSEGCVRLKYPSGTIVVDDIICGECAFTAEALGPDPVILRSDGSPTFHLANVADDIDMGITHVIRGQDHLTNSAKHVVLFQAAGFDIPKFAHLPLILGSDGSKLSKRNSTGYTTVDDFRNAGYLPDALMNFVCLLGWSHPESKDIFDLDEAVECFSLERVSRTGAKFELSKLDWYNGQYIRAKDSKTLADLTIDWTGSWKEEVLRRGMKFWENSITSLKTDFDKLTDVEKVANLLLSDSLPLNDEATEHLTLADNAKSLLEVKTKLLENLELVPLDDGADCYTLEQIKAIIKQTKKSLELPPKIIFQSIRILTTGALKGAELDSLLPNVPREILKSRIENCS